MTQPVYRIDVARQQHPIRRPVGDAHQAMRAVVAVHRRHAVRQCGRHHLCQYGVLTLCY